MFALTAITLAGSLALAHPPTGEACQRALKGFQEEPPIAVIIDGATIDLTDARYACRELIADH